MFKLPVCFDTRVSCRFHREEELERSLRRRDGGLGRKELSLQAEMYWTGRRETKQVTSKFPSGLV